MSFRWRRWPRSVPIAERRRRAASALEQSRAAGQPMAPVISIGQQIARTFWGQAWCHNLERYSDFENRLPRGRSYLRSGAVIDLQVRPGTVTALVSGSDIYRVTVNVTPLDSRRWRAICRDCGGAIESLVALLQGQFSDDVAQRICHDKRGFFPAPRDIEFDCSCPDWAYMCKHVAAVLYGIGVRLDREPALLFELRRVDPTELAASVTRNVLEDAAAPVSNRLLHGGDLETLFGIELDETSDDGRSMAPQAAQLRHELRKLEHELALVEDEIARLLDDMARIVKRSPAYRPSNRNISRL